MLNLGLHADPFPPVINVSGFTNPFNPIFWKHWYVKLNFNLDPHPHLPLTIVTGYRGGYGCGCRLKYSFKYLDVRFTFVMYYSVFKVRGCYFHWLKGTLEILRFYFYFFNYIKMGPGLGTWSGWTFFLASRIRIKLFYSRTSINTQKIW
jgi:hypothetical protein